MTSTASKPSFASTVTFKAWGERVRYIQPSGARRVGDDLRLVRTILRAAREERALLLNSSSGRIYPDLLACVLLGFRRKSRRPRIALMGDMWEPNDGLRGIVEKVVVRLVDRAVDRYLVLSREELRVFPRLWRVDPAKMRVAFYHYSDVDEELLKGEPTDGDYIFAGGNNARDYQPLIEAARRFPDQKFIFATAIVRSADCPPNVEAGPVSHSAFSGR